MAKRLQEEWMTLGDVARRLVVGEDTVRRWTTQGKLPHERLFGKRVYRRVDVERFAGQRTTEEGADPSTHTETGDRT